MKSHRIKIVGEGVKQVTERKMIEKMFIFYPPSTCFSRNPKSPLVTQPNHTPTFSSAPFSTLENKRGGGGKWRNNARGRVENQWSSCVFFLSFFTAPFFPPHLPPPPVFSPKLLKRGLKTKWGGD